MITVLFALKNLWNQIDICTKDGKHWICEQCYDDFKEMFGFKLTKE